jgi:hypothetical protein
MYPGPSARRFGSTGHEVIGGGHKIAVFPDAESGAAAQFDLLSRNYAGLPLRDAIAKWSGGNASGAYADFIAKNTGLSPDTVLTREILQDPRLAVPLVRSMAQWEAGRVYPLDDAGWNSAHSRAFGPGQQQLAAGGGSLDPASSPAPAPDRQPAANPGDLQAYAKRLLAEADQKAGAQPQSQQQPNDDERAVLGLVMANDGTGPESPFIRPSRKRIASVLKARML